MKTVSIIYWSGTGNTEAMASLIARGAERAGAQVKLLQVSQATEQDVTGADVCLLGCPSMGDEVLEESEFEPFMESIEEKLSGTHLALFGSYGWGDGQWMRDWESRVKAAGATLITDSLIVNESPEDEQPCLDFGTAAAQ